jgi:hypothetical protein
MESPSTNPEYLGEERRRHRVYMTRNTEYHFRDGFCVAVRDRRTGEWLPGHLALRRQLFGGLKFFLNGGLLPNPGEPQIGEALFFGEGRPRAPSDRVNLRGKTGSERRRSIDRGAVLETGIGRNARPCR